MKDKSSGQSKFEGKRLESETRRALLLIADISGYTKFMTCSRVSLAHAQAIITELMNSIISEINVPLHIVEVEGDAVFFYGVEEEGSCTWEQVVSELSHKILDLFHSFYRRLNDLKRLNTGRTNTCDRIGELKLKVISHIGDVLFYKIANFSKLSGPDVILIHRLLKNSVEANQYLLMTEQSFTEMSKYQKLKVYKQNESYEDFGKITVYVHCPNLAGLSKEQTPDKYGNDFFPQKKESLEIAKNF